LQNSTLRKKPKNPLSSTPTTCKLQSIHQPRNIRNKARKTQFEKLNQKEINLKNFNVKPKKRQKKRQKKTIKGKNTG